MVQIMQFLPACVQVPHTLVYTCINESMHTSYKLEICELDAIALATQAQWRLRDVSQDSGEDCAKVWRSHIFFKVFCDANVQAWSIPNRKTHAMVDTQTILYIV